jgi:LacI family transcriptional regulator
MNDRVTLQDVAREAGVHASTASRALNPQTRNVVSEATISRVLDAAERLAYRPHALARGLRTNRTMTVGMVVPDVENPLFPPMVRGVESELTAAGYSLLVANTDNDQERLQTHLAALLAQQVDGLILATALANDDLVRNLTERDVPLVLLNRLAEDATAPAIVGDDRLGIRLVMEHLAALGHRRIGHVAGPAWLSTGRARAEAFLNSAAAVGVAAEESLVERASSFRVQPGDTACRALLARHPEITAIVAGNDLLALGCYRALGMEGRAIPGDLSVTGYNDMPYVDLLAPPLTTVCVPYREMGRVGGTTLLELLNRPPEQAAPPTTIRLTPKLSVRASTGPPRS